MFCTSCGMQINDNAKFCTSCGKAVAVPPVVQDGNMSAQTQTESPLFIEGTAPHQDTAKTNNCKYCNELVKGKFCHNCGQAVHLERIDKHYFSREIRGFIGADNKTLHSFLRLLIHPGESTVEFIKNDRSKYVKPIVYLLFTSLVYTVMLNIFGTNYGELVTTGLPSTDRAFNWMNQNAGYFNLAYSFILAFFLKLSFKEYNFNIFEIFVLLCFLSGTMNLAYSVFIFLYFFLPIDIASKIDSIVMLVWFAYYAWGIASFFDKTRAKNYFKAFLCYVSVFLLFVVVLAVIGIIVDFDVLFQALVETDYE